MPAAISAGALYFALVFAIGFALGALRVTLIAPVLGEFAAVALEAPVMLVASWFASAWLIRSFRVPRTGGARLAMGAVAFVLLMAAELTLGLYGFGRSLAEQLDVWTLPAGLLGLGAQIAFGLIPFVQVQWQLRR